MIDQIAVVLFLLDFSPAYLHCTVLFIVVINVRKKIKNVNKRVFYEKNKKTLINAFFMKK